jgi:hypothetical protein
MDVDTSSRPVPKQPAPPSPSRRSFLRASVAVAAGAAPLPGSTAEAGRDDRLVELQQRLFVVERALTKTDGQRDLAELRIRRECPPPPELQGLVHGLDPVFDPMTDAKALARLARSRWRNTPSTRPPGLSRAKRAALLDRYLAQVDAACLRLGYAAFKPRLDALLTEQQAALDEILDTPAETIIGIIAKLRVVDQFFAWSLDRRKEDDYHGCLMMRTLRDAERIARM